MTTSDKKTLLIWKSFLTGDQEAFAHLYNQYVDSMYRYGTKICKDDDLVKDAIQEVFIDLFVKRHKNKTDPGNLKYYLILALKRNLIKKLKRNRKMVDEADCEGQFEPEYSIETILIENEEEDALNRQLAGALKGLPARQKEALYLRFNEAMDYPEIARVLDISLESARKNVYRALTTIRKKFGKKSFLLWVSMNSSDNFFGTFEG